jgi:ABC-2 type transport system permease protein
MLAAMRVEWLKLRRSRMSLLTAVIVGIGVPALTVGFLAAAAWGPADTPLAIKVNAMLVGEGWPAYLGMLAQILSVMSFLGVGIVVAWCFGREFTDHTITALFALPTSLATIAAAKYAVLLAWSLALGLVTLFSAFALAPLAGLPAPSTDALEPAAKVLAVGINGGLLAYPLAFIASAARGYLPAVGALILIVVVTQILTVIGVGAWVPFAATSLWAGMGGPAAAATIAPHHLSLIPLTAAAGVASTLWWWRRMQVVSRG